MHECGRRAGPNKENRRSVSLEASWGASHEITSSNCSFSCFCAEADFSVDAAYVGGVLGQFYGYCFGFLGGTTGTSSLVFRVGRATQVRDLWRAFVGHGSFEVYVPFFYAVFFGGGLRVRTSSRHGGSSAVAMARRANTSDKPGSAGVVRRPTLWRPGLRGFCRCLSWSGLHTPIRGYPT